MIFLINVAAESQIFNNPIKLFDEAYFFAPHSRSTTVDNGMGATMKFGYSIFTTYPTTTTHTLHYFYPPAPKTPIPKTTTGVRRVNATE